MHRGFRGQLVILNSFQLLDFEILAVKKAIRNFDSIMIYAGITLMWLLFFKYMITSFVLCTQRSRVE